MNCNHLTPFYIFDYRWLSSPTNLSIPFDPRLDELQKFRYSLPCHCKKAQTTQVPTHMQGPSTWSQLLATIKPQASLFVLFTDAILGPALETNLICPASLIIMWALYLYTHP